MPEQEPDSDPDPAVVRLSSLLADFGFPARKWELTTYAEDRGADGTSRGELGGLPEGLYRDLDAVLSMVRAAKSATLRHLAANTVIPRPLPRPRTDPDRHTRSTEYRN